MTKWEEKEASQWCANLFRKTFVDAKFSLMDGAASLTFLDMEIDGDAKVAVRSGTPAPNFELKNVDFEASFLQFEANLKFCNFSCLNPKMKNLSIQVCGKV